VGAGDARSWNRDAPSSALNVCASGAQGASGCTAIAGSGSSFRFDVARRTWGGASIRELIDVVRESALDKKGESFTALDVSERTILADAFAIVSGRSKIQTRAIADAIVEAVERNGYTVARVEGYADGSWILIDLGNVIVHVFTPEQRTFYNLERLWSRPNVVNDVGAQARSS
jgi:ribosome-associated protein